MRAYMIRHVISGEWLSKTRGRIYWCEKQKDATLWGHKTGPIQTMRHHHLDASVAEIVTFELTEVQ